MSNLTPDEKLKFLKGNYCFIGKNNSNKTNFLRQLSELNKEKFKNGDYNNISLYVNSEEIIINLFVEEAENPSTYELLYSLITYDETKKEKKEKIVKQVKQENKVQKIHNIVTTHYFGEYIELLKKIVSSEDRSLDSYFPFDGGKYLPYKEICSSGINSLLSTIACLLYCKEKNIETILIDEVEKHLDSINSYRLIKFIQEEFNDLNIVVSTHSEHIIAGLQGFTILDVETKKEYNSNDYNDIAIIQNKFFNVKENILDNNASNEIKDFINRCMNLVEDKNWLEKHNLEILYNIYHKRKKELDSNDVSDIELIFEELGEHL